MMKRLLIALAVLSACLFSGPMQAVAYNSFNGVDCAGVKKESAICNTNKTDDPVSGSDGLLAKITKIISYVAGVAAIISIIVGGIRYVTSGGDTGNIKKAKDTIFYALIGLLVIVVARTLILYVLSKL